MLKTTSINKINFRPPFNGQWFVVWGGGTRKLNRHKAKNQKFAFDFLMVDKNKKTFKGKGFKNTDYYCFKKEILAPANGTVIKVVSGVKDNKPGFSNSPATGNALFIRHSKNLISILAHLKNNSIKVKAGNKVKTGQILGLCGNSGHSSEPHLHYHLQNSKDSKKAAGIKCYFENIFIKKKNKIREIKSYSPIRGDIIWDKI